MTPRLYPLLIATLCANYLAGFAKAEHVQVFVLTGQSNSLGTTNGGEADTSPGTDPADSQVKFWWDNIADANNELGDSGGVITSLTLQQGGFYAGSATHWGPEISFGRDMFNAGVEGLMIIKASRGGGGNTLWQEGSADDHMYQQVVSTVTAAVAEIPDTDTYEIVGLLYLQGESNSAGEAAAAGMRLAELLDNLKENLPNASNLKAVIGGITAAGGSRNTTRTQQAAIAGVRSDIAYIDNLDLPLGPDNLHLNRSGKLTAGERFAAAALGLIDVGATPRISEFMADNGDTLADEDGDYTDWIEVFNPGPGAVDLAGYYLTDDLGTPAQWAFPAGVTLAPGEFRLVFASGKNRGVGEEELHTNFSLNAGGESLALVAPDGVSAVSSFEDFPDQRQDVSFGSGGASESLVAADAAARALVPSSGALGTIWTGGAEPFDDTAWKTGANGAGYDKGGGIGGVLPAAKASTEFDYRYELDVGAHTQDLDNNGTVDFFGSNANELPTLSGGIATFANGDRYRTDYGNSLIRANFSANEPFTIEVRMRVLTSGGGEGSRGTMGLFYRDSDGSGAVGYVGRGETGYLDGSYTAVDSNTNTDGFHIFRMAKSASDQIWIWRDGELINPGASALSETAVGSSAWGFYLGDTGSTNSGDWELDYVRVTPGAFEPAGGAIYAEVVGLDLETELSASSSAYVRLPFSLTTDPSGFGGLKLDARYDDGFVAYLNGTEVARRNAPATPGWNSTASSARPDPDALEIEEIDVSARLGDLMQGDNVLAVHLLNETSSADRALGLFELSGVVTQGVLRFFTTPTPGAANGSGVEGFVSDTSFDVDRGFYAAPFDVSITSATPGAHIYYTIDGSAPGVENGTLYSAPIPVNTTTPLRAIAVKENFEPSNVDTQTYLFLDDVLTQNGTGLPTPIDRSESDWDYVMDPNVVNDPRYSPTMVDDLKSLPTLSVVLPVESIWGASGILNNPDAGGAAWERACSMEMLFPDAPLDNYQEVAGIRIQGAGSRFRNLGKKSFRLAFRGIYGAGKLNERFFGPGTPSGFDNIVLRGSYFDSWTVHTSGSGPAGYIGRTAVLQARDYFATETHRAMGAHAILSNWVHVYFNGIYWGIYNTHERPDENFAALHLGGEDTDYDVLKQRPRGQSNGSLPELVAGDHDAWNDLMALASQNAANTSVYNSILDLIDRDQFIDYILLNLWGGNLDWPHNNWYAIRNRTGDNLFTFYSWDCENFLFRVNEVGKVDDNTNNTPGRIFQALRSNAEFRLRFADRVHKHMFNGGALTVAENQARMEAIRTLLGSAMNAESARWGDTRVEPPMNTIDHWLPVVDEKVDNYFPARHTFFLNLLESEDLYPSIDAPVFATHGGIVPDGFQLAIGSGAGTTMFYTLDGGDPREAGALTYSSPVALGGQVTVKARARSGGGVWSALTEATFLVGAVPATAANLVISELNYRPASSSQAEALAGFTDRDTFEFIELMNVSDLPIDLSGVRFIDGVTFAFDLSSILLAGERLVLARDAAGFEHRYGFAPRSEYTGSLSNDGERVTLVDRDDAVIVDMTYNDQAPWPESADGDGFTLVLLDGDPDNAANWRPSVDVGGTPGDSDGVPFGGGDEAALLKYAMGGGVIGAVLEDGFFVIEVPVNPAAEAVSYAIEISPDLQAWAGGGAEIAYLGESGGVRRFRVLSPVNSEGRVFVRLRVNL